LQRLGLLPAFLATDPLPCYANRSSWGGDGGLVDYDFIRDPNGNGWHIDRERFDRALIDTATLAGATLRAGTEFAGARQTTEGGWLLKIFSAQGPACIKADFVIDASGRRSAFARRIGIRRFHLDRLVAAAVTLRGRTDSEVDSTTLVEAVSDGWWYSALLPDGKLAVSFMTDPDLLKQANAGNTAAWWRLLESSTYTRKRVHDGGYGWDGPLAVAAAGTSRLEGIAGSGWLAAGDAAAAYDPLSSHGIGTAIATGAQAASAAMASLMDDPAALPNHAARVVAAFDRYLPVWRAYYADELRWPDAPFWSRRRPQVAVRQPPPVAV
jgi:flavin-dependent dehydrogenase